MAGKQERSGAAGGGEGAGRPAGSLSLYWQPVYRLIRKAGPYPVDEARDLTQDFFASLLETHAKSGLPSSAGEMRASLREALRGFLSNLGRRRPGSRAAARAVLSLDGADPGTESLLADADHLSPDEIIDRHWAEELLSRTA